MVTLDQYLKDVHARGVRILEHPDYAGVHSWLHMPGSYHVKGRAGDLNYGPSGAPAEEKPVLMWAARLAEAAGLNTIYAPYRTHPNARTNANHRDHLHVDDSPVSTRALKPRAGHVGDALYRKILAERPIRGKGKTRKPHAIATISRRHNPRGTWREKLWQTFLNTANKARLKVDGKFGPKTEAETIKWQRKTGLNPDGVVGPKTWFRAAWGIRRGRKGTRVKIGQRIMGYTGKDVDGKFGPDTDARAREVQRGLGVNDDGIWGPKTINALLRSR